MYCFSRSGYNHPFFSWRYLENRMRRMVIKIAEYTYALQLLYPKEKTIFIVNNASYKKRRAKSSQNDSTPLKNLNVGLSATERKPVDTLICLNILKRNIIFRLKVLIKSFQIKKNENLHSLSGATIVQLASLCYKTQTTKR